MRKELRNYKKDYSKDDERYKVKLGMSLGSARRRLARLRTANDSPSEKWKVGYAQPRVTNDIDGEGVALQQFTVKSDPWYE
jgi:hypothetical protein